MAWAWGRLPAVLGGPGPLRPAAALVLGVSASGLAGAALLRPEEARAEATATTCLRVFTADDVARHRDADAGIWVSYRGGVYDVTAFVQAHPGGAQRIMMAAGGPLEAYWRLYGQQ